MGYKSIVTQGSEACKTAQRRAIGFLLLAKRLRDITYDRLHLASDHFPSGLCKSHKRLTKSPGTDIKRGRSHLASDQKAIEFPTLHKVVVERISSVSQDT